MQKKKNSALTNAYTCNSIIIIIISSNKCGSHLTTILPVGVYSTSQLAGRSTFELFCSLSLFMFPFHCLLQFY